MPTSEVEKLIEDFERKFGGVILTQGKREKQDRDNDWLRTRITALLEGVVGEGEALSKHRFTDKKNHDVIHWLHVRNFISIIKSKI